MASGDWASGGLEAKSDSVLTQFSGPVNRIAGNIPPDEGDRTMIFYGLHSWRGESGRRYMFRCALTRNGIPDGAGGIYIFVKRHFGFFLEPLYVGKAADLRSRLLGHEKWGKAWWILGATERHVMRIRSEEERRMVEEDLIRRLKPRMNDVMMPRGLNDAPNTPKLRRMWAWRRKVEAWLAGLLGGNRKTDAGGKDAGRGFYDGRAA